MNKNQKDWYLTCSKYCQDNNYDLIAVTEFEFSYRDEKGFLYTKTVEDLYKILGRGIYV